MKLFDDIYNTKKVAKYIAVIYTLLSCLTIIYIDQFIKTTDIRTDEIYYNPTHLGFIFLLVTTIIIFVNVYFITNFTRKIEQAYNDVRDSENKRIGAYEFALDHSVDAVHWLDMDAKFVYANNATCELTGYTKEEFENLYLEDVDPSFNRETAKQCMIDVKTTTNWKLESVHKRKDGTIYPVDVVSHAITYDGEDYICAFARDMTQRLAYRNRITTMNEELQKSLKEKEILLKEIHHRVKNNMEIISSLLNMQASKSNDPHFKDAMRESRSKIHAMALVHEFLYLGENLAYINVNEYIERLVHDIKELYMSQNTVINVDLNIDKIEFSINRCIQVGMLLHELCVNALKYAFKENRNNLLCIHMKLEDKTIHVKIRDNGDDLEDVTSLEKSNSIGMQLIHSIVDFQLGGKIDFKNNNGLECNIFFPKKEYK